MSEPLIPQYAKSTDPEVLAVIARNEAGVEAWLKSAAAFAAEHSDHEPPVNFVYWRHGASRALSGVPSDTKPTTGQWKKGRRAGTWVPFKNNPIRPEYDAQQFSGETIPGLSDAGYVTGYKGGATQIHSPAVFMHDGVAYMGLGAQPVRDQRAGWGDGKFDHDLWTEILASEWHLAREAREAVTA